MNLWEIENEYAQKGYRLICGADEAGAGPLAGAVYAAAVILPLGLKIEGLNDSKKLSPKKREELYDIIKEQAVTWAVNGVDVEEIDRTDILTARLKAMNLCIEMLDPKPDFALIDGNRDKGISCPHITVVKGDSRSANIAAASILAKVTRDRYMVAVDKVYPEYGFAKHKGYPTKAHYEALRKYGPCPIHRRTFLKNL